MKVTISFIHMEHTPALDERIHEKSSKFEKYFEGDGRIKWTCYVQDQKHYSEVHLYGPHGQWHATASADNLYKSLHLVVEKLEKQVDKTKSKFKNKIHRGKAHLEIHDPVEAWGDYDSFKKVS